MISVEISSDFFFENFPQIHLQISQKKKIVKKYLLGFS